MTALATPPAQQLIDGKLLPASDGATYPILGPATGEVIGHAPDGTAADVDAAIAAARRAFDESAWSTDVALRVRCLRQLHAALLEEAETFTALTTAEVGMPGFMMGAAGFDVPVDGLRWVTDLLESYEFETDLGVAKPMGIASRRTVRREPVGVVAAITPWNVPTQINLAKIGPALAAGCTVVLKPAPDTPWVAAELGRIAAERTDLPAGVLNVVTPRSNEVAAVLASDPRVDMVSFTGSTATGRAIMAAAAPTLKKVFLELGGKSAAIALDDADVAAVAGATAFTACIHAGQGCAITTRLVVPRERYDEAVQVAAATMESIGVKDPADPGAICGPVISQAQRDRVESYLRLAEAEGGTFATGGHVLDRPGYWVAPTVVAGLDSSARVAQEEIFGPVLVVLAHDGDDDAVRIANDSAYGLSGSVDSGSLERAKAVADRIRTGTLAVNGGVWFSPDVPFGGYKQSGLGREMGVAGFEEYLETKSLAFPA
ncbi:aldehyde dehydrogenase [Nocardioides marmotae]|uniref:Aldehyde dehydrogenase n=1 Tax=Nocardioides marmotae TaxID=2663857 RepID=A0A6I3JAS6_9ACTN|nr:aldehyde dehydrogenase [Nocardioides marmotae]MCR6031575.1 aldehyde dehydrogenase [Gordonia jinghuaiqii]MBC9733266.1 aldehyde dehydrogenase [Nocardioides marmotae]MTB84377.1 aldehyde dehydrogenase [Nocardioides marmotae]MTB95214.1 aldehyde dehydrogenase [Nocardioides marmotae]QKE02308.1 aldehyde dehydrogenase [Nocardioides marmotae]